MSMLADFHFLRPQWLLLLLPLAWLWWQLLRVNRQSGSWHKVVDAHLLPTLLSGENPAGSRLAPYLLGIAWLILALALAGPSWQRLPQPVYQVQQYRVIALDLSLPMNVADLKPSRLALARFGVIDLVKQMEEGQVALIGFGAEPYVVSPLTSDGATIIAQVPLLGTDLLPTNGPPRADLALEMAGELLTQADAKDGDIILLSHRVNELQRAVGVAGDLGKRGYRVSVVGIGSTAGGPLPLPNGGFVKNPRGEIVISRLEAEGLATVARAGGGRFVEMQPGGQSIATLAPSAPGRTGAVDAESPDHLQADQWREAGPWLVLLLLPLAALAFRRGWISPLTLIAVLFLPAPDTYALDWESLWWRADQRAMRQLQAGDPASAAATFERNDWRAAAAYEAGDFENTLDALGQPAGTPDSRNSATAYNRGNALARLGRLDEAIAAYDEALAVDPADADARYNRELIQTLLDSQRAANQQDQPQTGTQQQDTEQQSPEQSQGQSDSNQSGEQSQQDGQGGGQDSASDSDAQRRQTADRQSAAGQDSGAPGDSGPQGENDTDGETAQRQQANTGQRPDEGKDGSEQSAGTAESDPGPGANEGDTAQLSEDGQKQVPRDESSLARADQGDVAADQKGQQGGEESAQKPAEPSDTPSATAGSNDDSRGNREQAEQPAGGGGNDNGEEQGKATDRIANQMAAGGRPGRDDLLGGAPQADTQQEQPAGRLPRTGAVGETEQAIEQMLRRVDDDPGGLLRQRFLLQHMRRNGQLP